MYQVKFELDGKTVYGIHLEPGQFADAYVNEAAARGNAIVNDAIFPKSYEVPLDSLTEIPLNTPGVRFGEDEYHKFIFAEHEKAMQLDEQLGPGVQVGKLIGIGVGDGSAYYVITKVNKKTVRLEWRGFSPDRWVDRRWGYEKTVPISDVEPFCRAHLFGRSKLI